MPHDQVVVIDHGQYIIQADGTKTPNNNVQIGLTVKAKSITASMDKLKELLNPKKMEPNRSVLVACHQNNQISDGGWEIKTKIKTQDGLYAPYTYSATEFHFSPIQITSYNN